MDEMSDAFERPGAFAVVHVASKILPVIWDELKRGYVYVVETSDIDRHLGEGHSLREGLHAAGGTEEVPDCFLVKEILALILASRKQLKLVFVHEVKQQAFFLTVRTIALEHLFKACLDFVSNCATVATASVFHCVSISFYALFPATMAAMSAINAAWHEKNRMPMPSTLAQRVKWHEAHLRHCGCRKDLPPTIRAELKKQGKKVCSRGHVYKGAGSCPICWKRGKKK